MKRKGGERIFACTFLFIFVVLVIVSMGYSKKARRLPLVVGIPGVMLAAVEVAKGTRLKRRAPEPKESTVVEQEAGAVERQRGPLMAIGWVVLLVGMIWVFGFFIAIPVHTFLFMRTRKESWGLTLFIAAIGFAVLYFLFDMTLNLELYPGLIFRQ
jgi:hypothetical protein